MCSKFYLLVSRADRGKELLYVSWIIGQFGAMVETRPAFRVTTASPRQAAVT